jgi:molybdenum-dependent DNA-binding transcriptional regulator ModE
MRRESEKARKNMTETLQQIMEEVERLDPAMQEAFVARAKAILVELEEEREWDALVNSPKSQRFLKKLIDEGRKEHTAGQTEEITGDGFV